MTGTSSKFAAIRFQLHFVAWNTMASFPSHEARLTRPGEHPPTFDRQHPTSDRPTRRPIAAPAAWVVRDFRGRSPRVSECENATGL